MTTILTGIVICGCLSLVTSEQTITVGAQQHMTAKATELFWLPANASSDRRLPEEYRHLRDDGIIRD